MKQIDCQEFNHCLDAYLDGELAVSEADEMQAHAHQCGDCAQALQGATSLRQCVRTHCGETKAPDSLRTRICERLEAALTDSPGGEAQGGGVSAGGSGVVPLGVLKGVGGWRGWQAVGLGGIAVLLVGLSLWGLREQQLAETAGLAGGPLLGSVSDAAKAWGEDEALALMREGVDWHQRQLPLDVTGPHGDEVGLWFRGKLDFPVRVPRFARRDITILGGRLAHVGDQQAALLMLAVKHQKVSLMVFSGREMRRSVEGLARMGLGQRIGSDLGRSRLQVQRVSGYNVAMVRDGDLVYLLTAELPSGELDQLVRTGFSEAQGNAQTP